MQKKEKIKPTYLTDAVVRGLSKRDIDYFISDTTPGLRIRVWPSGEKVWYFAYRPKGKYPQKIKLDNFRILSVRGARNRVKKTQSDLFNNIDPIESKKQWDDQPTLGEAVKGWYAGIDFAFEMLNFWVSANRIFWLLCNPPSLSKFFFIFFG